jgi:hypothetical protein
VHVALIVVPDSRDRADVAAAAEACGLRTLLTESVFEAMGLLGRTDIGAVVFPVGRRVLAVRGLCQLAIRHHPGVLFYAQRDRETTTSEVLKTLHYPRLTVVDPGDLTGLLPEVADGLRIASNPFEPESTAHETDAGADAGVEVEGYDETEATVVNRSDATDTQSGPQRPISLAPPPNFVSDEDDTIPHKLPTVPVLDRHVEDTIPHKIVFPLDDDEATAKNVIQLAQPSEPTAPNATPADYLATATNPALAPEHSTMDAGAPLLEGDLAETTGVELLMTLCAQGLTGHLSLNGEPGVFFYAGDPVWAEHPEGPPGWLAQMIKGGHVPAETEIEAASEAELISALMDQNHLRGQTSHNLCRGLVSEQVNRVVDAAQGTFEFMEQNEFLRTAPLVRVSLFGLLLARLRMRSSPSELLRRSNELGEVLVFPRPALAAVAPRLSSFAGGHNLAEVINGKQIGSEIWEKLRLDPVTGVLLLTALIDSGLATLDDEPVEGTGQVELTVPASVQVPLPYAEYDTPTSEEEDSARDEIFTLYMRLKPLSLPRDVLGVPIDAPLNAIEAAYEARMGALRPERIPAGSARQLMVARVLELREKVTRAYESLRLLDKSGEGSGPW